ncbi:MAG: L-threonylcarbamoyladenylate synthase [Planctomycetota bacterium]|nr:L-threonylcarbamoyladenylate synthase [Planctomycetota bacterium]
MDTRTVVISDPASDNEPIQEAGAALADGRLVVFPTETVYGLGASAVRPKAVEALSRLKERDAAKPFTLHLSAASETEAYTGPLPTVARRLVRKTWPGPLTLIVPDRRPPDRRRPDLVETAVYRDGTVGLRCPNHPVASAILASAGVPVVATSANLRGHPPPHKAADALAHLRNRVALVVDAGPTPLAAPSTVVRVRADDTYEVLREGAIAAHRIGRLVRTSILFVCTGNICRSPMAAGLTSRRLAETLGCRPEEVPDHGINVGSVGTGAAAGGGPSENAVLAASRRGADIRAHRTRPMTVDALRAADYIWVMTRGHRDAVIRMAPEVTPRVALLDPAGEDIADPIGGDLDRYRGCARRLDDALAERLQEIV